LLIQQKIANGIAQLVQESEEEELIQAKPQTAQRQPSETDGKPRPNNTGLPDNLKSGIEALSGMSLDHVKVHYNSAQPAQLNALAYAQGSDIHLAPGQEQHLPHEAWHIVQQAQGRVKPTMQMKDGVPVNDDAGLEREADLMGANAYAIGERSPNSDVVSDGSATPLAETVRTKIEHAFAGAFSALGRLDRTMSLASRAATHTEPTATLGSQVPKMGVPYQIRNHPTQHIDQTHPGTAMPLQRARWTFGKMAPLAACRIGPNVRPRIYRGSRVNTSPPTLRLSMRFYPTSRMSTYRKQPLPSVNCSLRFSTCRVCRSCHAHT
jgi:hypothetical protein